MKWEDRDKIYEEPTREIFGSDALQVSDVLLIVLIIVFLQEIEHKICVEKVLYRHVPSSMEFVSRLSESHVKKGCETRVSYQKKDENIKEALPTAVSTDHNTVLKAPLFLCSVLILIFFLLFLEVLLSCAFARVFSRAT